MNSHTSTWMIDSGSFRTLTPFREDFSHYELLKQPVTIKALGGFTLEAIAIGTVKLKSNIGSYYIELKDVLHVPKADGRLISVARLIRQNMKILFSDVEFNCTIFNSKGESLMTVPLNSHNEQYQLVTDVLNYPTSYSISRPTNSLEELHLKLGHAHPYVIKRMAKKFYWNISNPTSTLKCQSCVRGKSTKHIHDRISSRHAEHLGHIISGDLIDLHDTPSIGDYKYVSVLVDQFTYYTSVLPLKSKSAEETKNHIQAFNAFIRARTGNNIRIFRSDSGNEYRGIFASTIRDLGIYAEIGAPHEPRDNGFVERRNRTLTDMARTILLDSKLPLKFWPFAYDYSCYTQNRLGRRGYDYESPYYRVFKQIPDYSRMHPFGSSCFMQHTENGTHKLNARSDKAILLGYCSNTNGYKIFYNNHARIEQSVHFPPMNNDFHDITSPQPISPDPIPVSTPIPVPLFDNPPKAMNDPVETPIPAHMPIPKPVSNLPTRQSSRPSIRITMDKIREGGPKRRGINKENMANHALIASSIGATSIEDMPPEYFPQDPIGYRPSLKGPLAPFWAIERQKEIDNWMNLKVAEVSDLPQGHTAIPGHWIHSTKRDSQGKFVRLKARCVADGNHQIYGHNYSETYSATPAPEIARILLTVAASKAWEVHQMDVDCAYLNAELSEEVYMKIPPGVAIEHKPGQVLKLLRALYGLKQAGREWAFHLKAILESIGWKQSPREPCLYSRNSGEFVLVYVDDLMIVAPDKEIMKRVKLEIGNCIKTKDLGEIHDYLGIEVTRNRERKTFFLRQVGLIDDIVKIMNPTRITTTPMSTIYDSSLDSQPLNETDHNKYRSVLGKLLYLSRITRPDISISTNLLGRSVANPTVDNLKAMSRVAGYLLGSRDLYLALEDMAYILNLASSITEIRGPALLYCDNIAAQTVAQGQSGNVTKGAKHIDIRFHVVKELIESGKIKVDRVSSEMNTADNFTKPLDAERFNTFREDLQLVNLH